MQARPIPSSQPYAPALPRYEMTKPPLQHSTPPPPPVFAHQRLAGDGDGAISVLDVLLGPDGLWKHLDSQGRHVLRLTCREARELADGCIKGLLVILPTTHAASTFLAAPEDVAAFHSRLVQARRLLIRAETKCKGRVPGGPFALAYLQRYVAALAPAQLLRLTLCSFDESVRARLSPSSPGLLATVVRLSGSNSEFRYDRTEFGIQRMP